VHALPQQTPSAQNPLVHWPAATHATPLLFLLSHAPAAQNLSLVQSVASVHEVTHAPATHLLNGAHERAPWGGAPLTAVQVPTLPVTLHARQVAEQLVLQHTPSTQNPDAQSPPARHVAAIGCWVKTSGVGVAPSGDSRMPPLNTIDPVGVVTDWA
jgi:hypothetical protein